jgi:hypothetical protein
MKRIVAASRVNRPCAKRVVFASIPLTWYGPSERQALQ